MPKKKIKKTAKKPLKKKPVKKAAKKPAKKTAKRKAAVKKAPVIKEKKLGKVDHFFGHISVAAIKLTSPIKVGDNIHILGHTTNFTQIISSMQIEHLSVPSAKKGDDIGIKVKGKVREGDTVYLAK